MPFQKSDPTHRTAGWLWLIPWLTLALLIATVLTLLWSSRAAEREEQRATLISDMLWLDQNLRFALNHNEELFSQFGPKQIRNAASFNDHAQVLVNNQSGLRQIRVLTVLNDVRFEFPASSGPLKLDQELAQLARSIGKPVYGAAYPDTGNDWQFDVYVPLQNPEEIGAIVVATYSLSRLLNDSVPWWLAERYQIVVMDAENQVLIRRSKLSSQATATDYQLEFDPPGHGLVIRASSFRAPTPLAGRLISAALIILALVVLWSLWALRRDVQQRLAVEQALREEHTFRLAIEDSVRTGLRARDLTGKITYVNPAFCAMCGWSAAELIGQGPPMPYWVDEELAETRALHDQILAGSGPTDGFEVRFKRRNGEIFPVLIHESRLINAQGVQTGWISSIVDLTRQKQAEGIVRQQQERLQATSRLVAMGEMASSLAHELNQPLSAITNYNSGCLNMLQSGQADAQELVRVLTKSTQQAQRAGQIVRRIYEFVRRSEPKSEYFEFTALIDEMIGLIEPDARRQHIRIQRIVAADVPAQFQGDRVLLGQAIFNLMRNGMEAMRDTKVEQRQLTITLTRQAQDNGVDFLHLSVADRGCGISNQQAARLFEPLYTTKAEGMGMGLNICRSVIEGHKGRLWLENNPEGGSYFHISLPIVNHART